MVSEINMPASNVFFKCPQRNVQLIMLIIFSNDKSDHDRNDNSNSCSDESSSDTASVSGSSSCVNSNDLKRWKTRKGYVPKLKKIKKGATK